MPASSQGLPTSGMRDIRLPVFGLRIFTRSIHGRCGVWPSNSSQPSTARSFSSSREPITSKSPVTSSTQIGRARPQKRFLEIIQSPMLLQPVQLAGLAVDRLRQEAALLAPRP